MVRSRSNRIILLRSCKSGFTKNIALNSRLFSKFGSSGVGDFWRCWPYISIRYYGLNLVEPDLFLEVTGKRFGKAPLTAFARPDGAFFKLAIALDSPDDFVGLCLRITVLSFCVL